LRFLKRVEAVTEAALFVAVLALHFAVALSVVVLVALEPVVVECF
jgi:hypothetical protein